MWLYLARSTSYREGTKVSDQSSEAGVGGTLLRSFLGGQQIGIWNATWPLARLDIHRERLCIQASASILRVLVPRWEASFEEITDVRAIGNIDYFTTGIRFRTNRPSGSVLFWTFRRLEVLDALEAAGLTVNRAPVRLNYLHPDLD
jgi:hypothetical protein